MTEDVLGAVDYFDIDAVNQSSLKPMAISPLHYRYELEKKLLERATGTEPAKFLPGKAMHCLVLEPDQFEHRYVVYDGPVRRGARYDEFVLAARAENPDRAILIESEYHKAIECAKAILSSPAAGPYLDGAREQILLWTDRRTGLKCKGRPDVLCTPLRTLVELKSTGQYLRHEFCRNAEKFKYHVQSAFYLDGAAENGYDLRPDPVWIVVEASEPWDVAVYEVPEGIVDLGRVLYRRWLSELKRCRETDTWPGMAGIGGHMQFDLPAYAFDDVDERMEPPEYEHASVESIP